MNLRSECRRSPFCGLPFWCRCQASVLALDHPVHLFPIWFGSGNIRADGIASFCRMARMVNFSSEPVSQNWVHEFLQGRNHLSGAAVSEMFWGRYWIVVVFWSPLVCGAGQRIHLWNGNRHPFSILCSGICYLGCWNSCAEYQCHSSQNKSHHHRPQTVERQYGRQAARLGDQPRKVDTASQTSWKTRWETRTETRERQDQRGGHSIPDKADTVRKHWEPQHTVNCLGN